MSAEGREDLDRGELHAIARERRQASEVDVHVLWRRLECHPLREQPGCELHDFDGEPFTGAAVVMFVVAAALGDEGERVGRPVCESCWIETVGIGPRARIVVGAVEIEQGKVAGPEVVAVPLEVSADSGGCDGEEGVEATDFLDEVVSTVFVRECVAVDYFAVDVEGVGDEGDVDSDCDGGAQEIEQFDGRDAGVEQVVVHVAVMGEDGEGRVCCRGGLCALPDNCVGQPAFGTAAGSAGAPVTGADGARAFEEVAKLGGAAGEVAFGNVQSGPAAHGAGEDVNGVVV